MKPNEKQIKNNFDNYLNAYEKNKNIDVIALAANELNQTSKIETIHLKEYIISIATAPLGGIYYFIRYYFGIGGDGEVNKRVAIFSIVLSVVTLVASYWLLGLLFGTQSVLSPSTNQLNQDLNLLQKGGN